ncbi:protease complex subunit PrcB family protein [Marinobacter sp. F4218]|uniref:protease complex subunit PrcB family protein n=1 Tax=Marinobacter sp. F4218 TaxID=2862868 RepID=UPI001C62FD23|nr:protease complex subunit PrcB family protein [Marinobacter sp. F4218]MBW7470612.1 protease complex subunit PrcB family protein [Marinobacter sp. F4218]
MTLIPRVITGVAVLAGVFGAGCAVSQTETSSGAPLARQIVQSSNCGLTAPGHLHLKSGAEVGRLEALPGRSLPLAPLREIRFDNEHVILAALGQKPTGGYSVTLAGSVIEDDVLELQLRIQEPEPGTMVTQALTTPCAAIAVTASGWNDIRITPVENNR